MRTKIYANYTVSISQLKRNPQALIDNAHGDIIALLKGFRDVAYREGSWLRLLSLHPDHNSAYQ